MWFYVVALAFLLNSCVSNKLNSKHLERDYQLKDFAGVYVPRHPLDAQQSKVFGNRITIMNFTPGAVAQRLKASYQKLDKLSPAVTLEIVQETEEPTLAESTKHYYLLGVNQGPVDLIHYDFDGEHNAFERTETTLVKNRLSHKKTALMYKLNDKSKKTSDAGLTILQELDLYGRTLVISHEIQKLENPWLSVFPMEDLSPSSKVRAVFLRVEQPRYDASFRLHRAVDHRR